MTVSAVVNSLVTTTVMRANGDVQKINVTCRTAADVEAQIAAAKGRTENRTAVVTVEVDGRWVRTHLATR